MKRLLSLGLIPLALAGLGATCSPAPPAAGAACTVDVRFDDADLAHVNATTNLDAGARIHVELHGNQAPMESGDFTTSSAGTATGTVAVPDWGYPVAWDIDVYYAGARLCADWATQGARYITDPEWWDLCTVETDPECAYDLALQSRP